MFNIIIGFSKFTPNIIDYIKSKNESIILLSNKIDNISEIKKSKNLQVKSIDIENYELIFNEASKPLISNIYIHTDNDMQNILLADSLVSLKNVTVIFNNNDIKFLTTNEYKCIFLGELLYNSLNMEA